MSDVLMGEMGIDSLSMSMSMSRSNEDVEDGSEDVENWLSVGEYIVEGDDGKSVSMGLECCVLSMVISVGDVGYEGDGGRCVCSKGILAWGRRDLEGGISDTGFAVISWPKPD